MKKNFHLKADDIRPLAEGHGGCIATDMITVEGKKVGFMYRVETSRKYDSGWCFTSGEESQEYMDNPQNHEIYDVNTIANYDPDIIPFLNSPPGSAFKRENGTGKFIPAESPPSED